MILGLNYVKDGFIATEGHSSRHPRLPQWDGMGNVASSNYTAAVSNDKFVSLFLFSVYLAR